MKKFLMVMSSIIFVANTGWSLDKQALAVHLRKALNLDSRTDIQITGDPQPAGIGDLKVINATVGGAPYPVYLSPDEKKYIWGFLVDATVDPDKARADMINPKTGHAKGSATAPITVVEFSDLQCSHCKHAHDEIGKNLYKTYKPEQVRLVFKHFPLNGHDWAEPAAAASECAAKQRESAFWDMTDYFFDNQETIKKENVQEKALSKIEALKLDKAAFQKCMADPATMESVQAQKKEGAALGVGSTPTLFINGRQRRGFRDFDDIKVVIEEKLAGMKK